MVFNIKNMWWLFAVAAVVLLYILMTIPEPSAEGTCGMSCIDEMITVPYESGSSIELSGICPSSCDCCEITNVEENIVLYGWNVYYKCCNCQGSTTLSLQDCEDIGLLGPVYRLLGWCE